MDLQVRRLQRRAANGTMTENTTDRISADLAAQPRSRSRRHHPRRQRWIALALLALLGFLAGVMTVKWGGPLRARFQQRAHQTVTDLPHETADVALPPICFLLALITAVMLGILVYKLGRPKGFVLAGVNTAVVFLLWAWALSGSQVPLESIELGEVRLGDVLYVLSFFTVVLVPLSSYFAWFRASLR